MYKIIIEVLDIMNNSSSMITSTFFKFTWQELSILINTLLPFIWISDNSKIVNSPVNFEITRFNCIIHILNWPKIHFHWKKVTYNKTWLSQKKTKTEKLIYSIERDIPWSMIVIVVMSRKVMGIKILNSCRWSVVYWGAIKHQVLIL